MSHIARITHRLLLPVLLLAPAVAAAGQGIRLDPREMMPLREVRVGMHGVGRTVFRGTKIETFDVKVVGVLPNANLGGAYILVRMSGGPITERSANLVMGMSGSPVYIKGRLIGAISAGYAFSREPLALVTPIEDMLETLDPSLEGRASVARARRPGTRAWPAASAAPIRLGGRTYHRVRILRSARPGAVRPQPGTLDMAPLAVPVSVSGMSRRGVGRLGELLEPFGAEVMPGPGRKAHDRPIPLVAGSALAVMLASGDVEVAATGTVTYRKGKQILAFGHSFMQLGAVRYGLATAYVHEVFPSLQFSRREASPVSVVGTIQQDRPWAVGGVVGTMPRMIPVVTTIRDFSTGRQKTLRVQVVDNRFLTGQIIQSVVNEGVFRVRSVPGDATARVQTEIVTDGLGTLKRENLYYDASAIDMAALGDLMAGISLLSSNPWQRVPVRAVRVRVDIDGARRTATIERATVDREKYEPGDTVKVEVTLRPWEKPPVSRTLALKIPPYVPNGRVTLRVHGGSGVMPAPAVPEGALGGTIVIRMSPTSPLAPATSLHQLAQNYREKERNNDLVARLALPTFTANLDGHKMRTLPPPLLDVMRNPRNSTLQLQNDEVKARLATPWVIGGGATVSFAVQRRTFAEKEGGPGARPGPPPPPGTPEPEPPRPAFDSGFDFDALDGDSGAASPVSADLDRITVAAASGAHATSQGEAKMPPTPAGAAAGAPSPPEGDAGKPRPDVEAPPVRPAGRLPSVWRQNTAEAFARGRLTGAATSSRGQVTLSPSLEKLPALDAAYVWSVVASGGAVYAGTGDRGVLYRTDGGAAKAVLRTSELQVLSLAADSRGNVYAGTAPHGLIYRVSPDGKGRLYWRSPEEYILSLAVDSRGTVYAGTSPQGRIYRVTPEGKGSLFARVPEPYVVSLACMGDDLYAGTGTNAVVYRVTPDGRVTTFYDPGEGSTSSVLATDGRGRVYVGTAPRGMVYRVENGGRVRVLYDKAQAGITAMAVDPQGTIWAASGEGVYRITDAADEPVVERIEDPAGSRFLAIAADTQGGVYLGTATGHVARLAPENSRRGVLESAVHDAGSIARWGRLTWNARTPSGTRVVIQTRTGNSEEPDATWSPWSEARAESGLPVASPPGRYLQYRAILTTQDPRERPALSEVAVTYLPQNREPKLTVAAPKGGEAWARKQTVRWTCTDPDGDILLYEVYVSRDNGATWTRLERPAASPSAAPGGTPDPGAKPAAGPSAPPAPQAPPKRKVVSFKETSLEWDTRSMPDGRYLIKVVATDRLSNPEDGATVERVVGPVVVANGAPRVALGGEPAAGAGRDLQVTGRVQASAPLAGVDYRVDDGEWISATPEDGIFDGETESFRVRTAPLEAGEHSLELRAVDAAGNHAEVRQKVVVR